MQLIVHYKKDGISTEITLKGSKYIPRVGDVIRLKECDLLVKKVIYNHDTEYPVIIDIYCEFCNEVVIE